MTLEIDFSFSWASFCFLIDPWLLICTEGCVRQKKVGTVFIAMHETMEIWDEYFSIYYSFYFLLTFWLNGANKYRTEMMITLITSNRKHLGEYPKVLANWPELLFFFDILTIRIFFSEEIILLTTTYGTPLESIFYYDIRSNINFDLTVVRTTCTVI